MRPVVFLAILLGLVCSVYAAGTGEACSTTADCDIGKGLKCVFRYSACSKGQCECPVGETYTVTGCNITAPALFLDEPCEGTSDEVIGVFNGICNVTSKMVTCKTGYVNMGNSFCRGQSHKVLGDPCPNNETCYTYGDRLFASSTFASCEDESGTNKCVCSKGYTVDESTPTLCRQKTVGEPCTDNADCVMINQECPTGSNATCQCVADTEFVAGACQVSGTVAEGDTCAYDPLAGVVDHATTCTIGLVCQACPGNTTKTCLMASDPDETTTVGANTNTVDDVGSGGNGNPTVTSNTTTVNDGGSGGNGTAPGTSNTTTVNDGGSGGNGNPTDTSNTTTVNDGGSGGNGNSPSTGNIIPKTLKNGPGGNGTAPDTSNTTTVNDGGSDGNGTPTATDVKFGGACSSSSECESNKGLECKFPFSGCSKGKCDCAAGKTYDPTDETCKTLKTVLYLGDACTGSDDRITIHNAICSEATERVVCAETYDRLSNSFCKAKAKQFALGEDCSSGSQCYSYGDGIVASSTITSCEESKCVCAQGYEVDKTTSTLCRQKTVGDECTAREDCPKTNQECSSGNKCECVANAELVNAECQVQGALAKDAPCQHNSDDTEQICSIGLTCGKCPESPDAASKCLKNAELLYLDDDCNGQTDNIAVANAECRSQKVECKAEYTRKGKSYCQPVSGQAVVGDTCNDGDICVSFGEKTSITKGVAFCRDSVGTTGKICTCKSGYVVDKVTQTLCVEGSVHGEACSDTAYCLDDLVCTFQYSTCAKGVCLCPAGHTYDEGTRKCTQSTAQPELRLGDTCTGTNDKIPIKNAVCSSAEPKVVECANGFTKRDAWYCVPDDAVDVGKECTDTSACVSYGDVPGSYKDSCVSCTGESGSKTCTCNKGYIKDKDIATLCRQKTVGDPCSDDDDCPKTHQKCSTGNGDRNTCECETDTAVVNGHCLIVGELDKESECIIYSNSEAVVNKSATCKTDLVCGYCPGETTKQCLAISREQYLGDTCTRNHDKIMVDNAECSKGKTVVCRTSFKAVGNSFCQPESGASIVGETCTTGDTCISVGDKTPAETDIATCTKGANDVYKCTCNTGYLTDSEVSTKCVPESTVATTTKDNGGSTIGPVVLNFVAAIFVGPLGRRMI